MLASIRLLVVALASLSTICLLNFCLSSSAAAQPSDEDVAERVLGPQWKRLSRRAGMIFAGTVLTNAAETGNTPTAAAQIAPTDRVVSGAASSVQLSFRVDRAIVGVNQGQILTIHEWAGAWAMQRPMRPGQHILIFLYPTSRLGFTSAVSGSLGQIALDSNGENASEHEQRRDAPDGLRGNPSTQPLAPVVAGNVAENSGHARVSVIQLERAIRSAREE